VKAVEVVNIHARFVTWFVWGFINWFTPLFMVALGIMTCAISQYLGIVVVGIFGIASACSSLAWFIVGAVWRFNLDG